MDEKKLAAAVRGAKKLIELNTPEDEIASTLRELGIPEENTAWVIAAGRKLAAENAAAPKPVPEEKNRQPLPVMRQDIVQERGRGNGDSVAQRKPPQGFVQKKKMQARREVSLLRKILPFGRSYIPKLRTGGRKRVKEIIVESPLDAE